MADKKVVLVPGNTYTVEEFISTLRKSKTGTRNFQKKGRNGFFSYLEDRYIPKEEVDKLVRIVGEESAIYNYFNTIASPGFIQLEEKETRTEEVESNNIYDKMAARSETDYEGSFKLSIKWGEKPITVVRKWTENSTLSMRDIVNFM